MIGKMYPMWVNGTLSDTYGYSGGTYLALLLKAAYTYSTSHQFVTDVSAYELSGGGYFRVTPSGFTILYESPVSKITFDPITFANLTATGTDAPRYLIIARTGAGDSTSALILMQDFEVATPASAEDLTLVPSAAGLIRYTPA